MKNLWRKNNYTIILLISSFIAVFIISHTFQKEDYSKYGKITIQQGESLWEISEKYSTKHNLSANEFIKWVEKANGISGEYIFPGEELVIPVKDQDFHIIQVASTQN